jgi:Outer membrane protein beta-barrel domain
MKRTTGWTHWPMLAAIILTVTLSTVARAQASGGTPSVGFGVLGGASIPTGDFGNFAGTGWHAGALLDITNSDWPIGFRIDGVYHKFGNKSEGNPNMIVGTANALWMFPMTQPATVKPYLIGGVGIYNERCDGCNSQTKFGINGGAGLELPLSGLSTIIEARYHLVFDSNAGSSKTSFVPISVGILFR